MERSPQQGRRRKQTAQGIDRALRIQGPGFDLERDGTIHKGAIDIRRYDSAMDEWEIRKKAGWQSPGLGDWHSILKIVAEA